MTVMTYVFVGDAPVDSERSRTANVGYLFRLLWLRCGEYFIWPWKYV